MKDFKGREWDYSALVTNDASMDAAAISQLYRDRGDCENNFDEFKNQWGWAGFTTRKLKPCKVMARLVATSTHADSTLIQRALDTVAAFFRWLGSSAEQLEEKTRWTIVVRCAFRRILLPDPALKPLYALK